MDPLTFYIFDSQYVERLRKGEPDVEEHFASYFGDLLYLKLRTRLRSWQLVEDIRQETLLRVLMTLRRKGGVEHPERFGAFVNAVCNNVMMEHFRSESHYDQIADDHKEPADKSIDLDRALIARESKQEVERVLAELPQKDRDLLREVLLEDRDKAEVCARLHVDPDYLRVLLHRAKSRFRKAYMKRASGAPERRAHVVGP